MDKSKLVKDELPPEDQLVLVWQDFTGYGLRSRHGEYWYDESENLDDSELEIIKWWELPLDVIPQDHTTGD